MSIRAMQAHVARQDLKVASLLQERFEYRSHLLPSVAKGRRNSARRFWPRPSPWGVLNLVGGTGFALLCFSVTVWGVGPPEESEDPREVSDPSQIAPPEPLEGEGHPRPGRPPRFGPGGPPGGLADDTWFQLSDTARKELTEFLNEHFPVMAQELDSLKERRPELYQRRLRRIAPEMHRLMDVMQTDPQRGKLMILERRLDLQSRFVAREYHRSQDNQERAALRDKLSGLLGQIFDCRRQRRELEIRDLELRIDELKAELESMSARRQRIIENQLQDRLDHPEPQRPVGEGHPLDVPRRPAP